MSSDIQDPNRVGKQKDPKHARQERIRCQRRRNKEGIVTYIEYIYSPGQSLFLFVVLRGHSLRDLSQRLQIASHYRVDEDAGLFLGVTLRDVHLVRFDDERPGFDGVQGSDGTVVPQAMISADDAEAEDVLLVIQDV